MVCHETRNKNVQFNMRLREPKRVYERERERERNVRSIMRCSLGITTPLCCPLSLCLSLAVIDYVHRQYTCVCVCVSIYINLSLFCLMRIYFGILCPCVHVHKNNPFTGWFNFLLGVCMRVRVCVEAGTHLVTLPETVA